MFNAKGLVVFTCMIQMMSCVSSWEDFETVVSPDNGQSASVEVLPWFDDSRMRLILKRRAMVRTLFEARGIPTLVDISWHENKVGVLLCMGFDNAVVVGFDTSYMAALSAADTYRLVEQGLRNHYPEQAGRFSERGELIGWACSADGRRVYGRRLGREIRGEP